MMGLQQEIDRALLELERPEGRQRAAALEHLLSLTAREDAEAAPFVELLPRLVADPEPAVRRAAASLAATVLEGPALEAFLTARLADPSPNVRVEAAGQLADLRPPSARVALTPLLRDPAFPVRFEAARGIAEVGHSAGREVLEEGLHRGDFRFRALGALAALGDVKALPAIRKVFNRWWLPGFERTQAAGALARLGDAEGAQYLAKRISRRGGLDRAMAIELCGEVNAPDAARQLKAILADPKDLCRGAAARGLGRLKDATAEPLLVALLEGASTPEELRLDAAEGLCLLGTPAARAHVERALAAAPSGPFKAELEESLRAYPGPAAPLEERA